MAANVQPGFDFDEMRTLLEIAQQTYAGIAPSKGAPPVPAPPANRQLDTDLTPKGATLLDNYWQVRRNQGEDNQYCIAVRGAVATAPSVLEDLLLPPVRVRLAISLAHWGIPLNLDFDLACDEADSPVVAGVHAGFALGLMSILFTTNAPLWVTLLGFPEDARIYITGHSQGASVALLLTSFVRHSELFSFKHDKTYVFAPAKPGNDHYAYDLGRMACVRGLAYSAVSTQDWVPQVPFTLEGLEAINRPNPLAAFPNGCTEVSTVRSPPQVQHADAAEQAAREQARARLQALFADLRRQLPGRTYGVTASQLCPALADAAGADRIPGSACLDSILDQLMDAVLRSLNFTKAGTLVPAFATPGSNPEDPNDFFRQHHLGNYLKYLTDDYG